MADDRIQINFDEDEHWTRTTVLNVEKWDKISRAERCGCGAIAEYTLRLDMISSGGEQELDVCARCLSKYTHGFDRHNIFRSKKDREFPDKYA